MAWIKEAVSDGELDALSRVARMAWADDTRLPRYAGGRMATGQCYVTAVWLVRRLGGHVGLKQGHYAWLSPDKSYHIDLTGGHTGEPAYTLASGWETFPTVENERTARFCKRADRIFDNLDTLLKLAEDLGAGDAYPAEEPQRSSDIEQQDSYWHDEPAYQALPSTYRFMYGQGQMEVSPNHSHDELAGHLGIEPNSHTGPVASGHIVVQNNKATFETASNVNVKALERVFKDYAKQVGWQWGGITNAEGEPISDEFAPKTTSVLNWVYDAKADHLHLGRVSHAELLLVEAAGLSDPVARIQGSLHIRGSRATVSPVSSTALPALIEWAGDNGLTLYAGNDNVYKKIPTLDQHNNTDPQIPSDSNLFGPTVDERDPAGLFRCPSCDRLFGSWDDYNKHRREEETWGDPIEDGKFPAAPDMDSQLPAHYTPQQPSGVSTGSVILPTSVHEARRVHGFSKYAQIFNYDTDAGHTHYVAFVNGSPVGHATVRDQDHHIQMVYAAVRKQGVARALMNKLMRHYPELVTNVTQDWEKPVLRQAGWVNTSGQMWKWSLNQSPAQQIEAPVPFIYDVQDDEVTVGNAGQRTADIPGRFTPGGIVEGTYDPGGKIFLRSLTTIPYTVRHLVQLWYHTHPELEVKSVHLRDDEGKDTRLARFEAKIQKTDDCWFWTGAKGGTGYGNFWTGERYTSPHRFAYHEWNGNIPEGWEVDHTCENKLCVNPDHLEAVTSKENMERMGARKTHCPQGHPYDEDNTYRPKRGGRQCRMCRKMARKRSEMRQKTLAHAEIGPMVATLARASNAVQMATAHLEAWGGEVYVVGGAVRDVIAGKTPKDFDLMVRKLTADEVAGQLKKLPGRVDYTGKDFGVFRLKMAGDKVEIALPRLERSTGEGHRDFEVTADHTLTPEEDLYRRDFTVNAMAVGLRTTAGSGGDGLLLDPFGGTVDVGSKTLRVLNEDSLAEDPLRVVRALVATARHGFEPEPTTRRQMMDNAHRLSHLPAERIQAELDKLMDAENPVAGIKLAHSTGVLKHIFPEVDSAFGYDQKNPHHAHDLGTHLMEVLERMCALTEDRDLRYAALLHDIGKPASAWWHPVDKRQKYYEYHVSNDLIGEDMEGESLMYSAGTIVGKDHHTVGGDMARRRLRALKFPNDRTERIGHIIDEHMWHAFDTKRAARKFIARVGQDHVDDLLLFRVADQGGKGDAVMVGEGRTPEGIRKQASLVNQVRNDGEATDLTHLAVDGNDLIGIGIPKGPEIGRIKKHLLSQVLENPELNTRDALLGIARTASLEHT